MKAKEKVKKKHIGITLKNIISFFSTIVILLYIVIFYNFYFGKNDIVYAKETSGNVNPTKISKAGKIDLGAIVQENIKEEQKEEYTEQEVTLEYITKYRNNASMSKGELHILQEGREGKQKIVTKKTYQNGELITEEQVSAKIIKASIDEIVEVGTGNFTNNYKVKIGDVVYVTSDRISVMSEPNEQSQKVNTLAKDNALKVLAEEGEWYKISYESTIGYVKIQSTKYIAPLPPKEEKTTSKTVTKTKEQLNATLSFDMALNKPSGLTLEQFKKVLTDSKDTKKIFENNAEYFYYIEKQYNINGVFVAAVGIHESAWGTSQIATNKNNLFGYGANDSNPYNGAYSFSNYSECIDLIARVFVKYYINPKGKIMYGDKKAEGTYYNGSNLSGINTKYASDKNWASGVYNHMKYLYNKL